MTTVRVPLTYPLNPVAKSANYTAAPFDFVIVSGQRTITLPAPVRGTCVAVKSTDGTGAAPVTVTTPSGLILGLGIGTGNAGAASALLGMPGAYVVLQADGTNWHVIAGQQDTGHIAFPFAAGMSNLSGHVASYRKMGDWVTLRGFAHYVSGTPPWTVGTLPAGFRPLNSTYYVTQGTAGSGNGSTPYALALELDGVLSLIQNSADNWTGSFASLAVVSFVAVN